MSTRTNQPILDSTLSCPHCGAQHHERMPTDACQYFYQCSECQELIKPKPSDCCVYCSYGTVRCPPMQSEGGTCC